MTQINKKPRKVTVIGESNCGKTSITLRLTENKYSGEERITIGGSFRKKTFTVSNDQRIDIHIWDTCGEEQFRSIVRQYLRGSTCVIVVFDVSNRESFIGLDYWLREVTNTIKDEVPIIIVESKIDLPRMISNDEVESLCDNNNYEHFQVSSKTGEGINELFQRAAELAFEYGNTHPIDDESERVDIKGRKDDDDDEKKKKCC